MILNQYTIPMAGQNVRGGLPLDVAAKAAEDQMSPGGSAYRFNRYASGPDAALQSAMRPSGGGGAARGLRPAPIVGGGNSPRQSPNIMAGSASQNTLNYLQSQGKKGGATLLPNQPGWQGQGGVKSYQGGSWSNPGGGGGTASGGMPADIGGLVNKQVQENAWAKNQNQANWEAGKAGMQGAMAGFNQDPNRQAAMDKFKALMGQDSLMGGMQGLAQGLLANPESINDQTQQSILNRNAGTINAQFNQRKQALLRQLAAQGMAGGSSAQAALGQLERERAAALQSGQTQLEIQRAQNRSGDIRNALGAAGAVQGQGFGQGMQSAGALLGGAQQQGQFNLAGQQALLANSPQYRPDDYAGLIGAMAAFNQPQGQGQGMAPGGGGPGQMQGPSNFTLPNGQSTAIPGLSQTAGNWMQNLMNQIGSGGKTNPQHFVDQGLMAPKYNAKGEVVGYDPSNPANPYGSWMMQQPQMGPTANFFGAAEAPLPRPVIGEIPANFQGWRLF